MWMWPGRTIIKGTAKRFNLPSNRENESGLPITIDHVPLKHDPEALHQAPEELAALDSGLDFQGEGSVRGKKLIESGWNASDPRLCPQGLQRRCPQKERLMGPGRSANILPFHTPIKPRLNPSASQPQAPGVAVLFSLVFYIGSQGGRFRSLALTK